MPKNSEPQEYTAERKGQTDLKFKGFLLAEIRENAIFGASHEIARIYKTVAGSYIAQYVAKDSEVRITDQKAAKCSSAAEILAFFTLPPAAPQKPRRGQPLPSEPKGHLMDIGKRVLEKAGNVEEALKDAHVEQID